MNLSVHQRITNNIPPLLEIKRKGIHKKISEEFNHNILKVEKILENNEGYYYKINSSNCSAIFNKEGDKLISDCEYIEQTGNASYFSRYYEVGGKIYYTSKNKIDDNNFIQIYDLKNNKGNTSSKHILFNDKKTEIIYEGIEGDSFVKKVGNKTIIISNGEKYEVNLKNGETKKIVEKSDKGVGFGAINGLFKKMFN